MPEKDGWRRRCLSAYQTINISVCHKALINYHCQNHQNPAASFAEANPSKPSLYLLFGAPPWARCCFGKISKRSNSMYSTPLILLTPIDIADPVHHVSGSWGLIYIYPLLLTIPLFLLSIFHYLSFLLSSRATHCCYSNNGS